MGFANEILDAIEIMVRQVVEDNTTKIYTGVCKTVSTSTCSLLINGKENTVKYYGGTPTVGTVYQVFIPFGNMSAAFIIVPGAGGQDPETGVSSVNGKTGAVVLTQDDVGNGVTYVRTHNDFTDAAKQQINTNEDNIAMLDSDMEAAQGDITTLKGNVTTLTTALQSKQDKIVGGASTITDDNLTANRALVSDGNGKVVVSNVTNTELGYLDGVTSNVQSQIDSKVNKSGDTMTGNLTVGSAKLETNGYVTGTWLKTTANVALDIKPSQIAVINNGWIYSRTPAQIKDDIGLGDVISSINGQTGVVTLGANDIGALPLTGGTMSGVINMNGAKITNVGTPTVAQDAANKAYVDSVKGVEVLTQSAEPTTQVTGDFWFQES